MFMEKQNNIKFLQIDSEILNKPFVVLPDCTQKILGAFERMLYTYLKFRYEFFKKHSCDYFESQESICNYFPFVSLKTVQRSTKTLEDCGLILVTRKGFNRNNKYVVNDIIMNDGEVKKNDRMFRHKSTFQKQTPSDKVESESKEGGYKFYIQYWFSPFFECIKFGVAMDVSIRKDQQERYSMFSHLILKDWSIPSKSYGLQLENEIKKNFNHSGCLKVWAPDGFSETVSIENKQSVIDFIENYLTQTS